MKQTATALCLAALSLSAVAALPKLGYYKALYSADHGAYGCAQVLSNTDTAVVFGKRVAYFKWQRADGTVMNCVPKMFSDTDDTSSDGDPTGPIFVSGGTALCTTADGKVNAPVEFDSTHLFWGGDSMGRVRLADGSIALALQKERQTLSATFYSDSVCP